MRQGPWSPNQPCKVIQSCQLVVCASVNPFITSTSYFSKSTTKENKFVMYTEEKWNDLKVQYDQDGYLIIPNLLSEQEIHTLLIEATEIARGNRGFIQGINNIPDHVQDNNVLEQYVAVHFPHKVSDVIRQEYISHTSIVEILSHLTGPNVKCMQSMLFIKPSGKPGQAWHQDEHYIPTRDRSLTAIWIALDDATIQNGCLWVRPGSHTDGILYNMAPHHNAKFDSGYELTGTPSDDDVGIPAEVKRGSAVVFNGYLHHRSLPNCASRGTFRRALVNHYMNAESLLPWDMDGRTPPTRDNRDIIMVCGKDPYNWKGIQEVAHPFLRAETTTDDDPLRKVF
eukprot:GSChrysophyteH2.ASY1.ANO1.1757.1 assembled CDS